MQNLAISTFQIRDRSVISNQNGKLQQQLHYPYSLAHLQTFYTTPKTNYLEMKMN